MKEMRCVTKKLRQYSHTKFMTKGHILQLIMKTKRMNQTKINFFLHKFHNITVLHQTFFFHLKILKYQVHVIPINNRDNGNKEKTKPKKT